MKSKHPINVEVSPKYDDEPLERMIKRFTKKMKKHKILEKVRKRRYYEKPSAKRQRLAQERKKVLNKLRAIKDKKEKIR